MATLPTNFSVTKTRSCPIPNPEPGVPSPDLINPEDFVGPPKPFIIDPVSGTTIPNPVLFGAQPVADVDAPDLINPESQPGIDTPDLIASESQPNIDSPDLIGSESQPDIDTPDLIGGETQPDLPVPSVVTPVAGTLVVPPFPLNHARIDWDNYFFNYTSVTSTAGTNPVYAVLPNSYQRWEFDNTQSITVELSSNRNVDTVCIGAHNLSGFTISVEYDSTTGGAFVPFDTDKILTTNTAIMFHIGSTLDVRRIRITATGTGVSKYIGYI